MNILRILFELFLLYLLYKLIFDFIIPIYQATKQVKKKVNEMNSNMKEYNNKPNSTHFSAAEKESVPMPKKDDYIDFEELK